MVWRWVARLTAALAVVVTVAVLGGVRPASAHTNLQVATPADGSVLAAGPSQLTLQFSEAMSLDLASVTVTHADGTTVATAPLALGDSASTLVVALPAGMVQDVYRVAYRVRDPVDLHLTTGSIVFGVGRSADAAGADEVVAVQPFEAGLRWVEWSGLALAIGAAALLLRHARAIDVDADRRRVVRRALRLVVAGAVAAVVADGVAVFLEVVDVGGSLPATARQVVFSSAYGRRLLIGLQLATALVFVVRLGRPILERRRGPARTALEWAPAALVGAMVLSAAYASHADVGGTFATGVGLRVAHLAGLGLWVGGLAAIVASTRGIGPGGRRAVWQSFSPSALLGAVLTIASGLVLTGREVASPTALARTSFGQVLLGKALVVAVILVLGVRHGLRVRRVFPLARRSLLGELGLASAVLAAGAVLAALPPAIGARFAPATDPSPSVQTAAAGDLLVRVALGPNHPGPNTVDVVVLETRRPSLGPIDGVTVTLTTPDGTTSVRSGVPAADGSVALAPLDVAAPGSVRAVVEVDRPNAPVHPVDLDIVVDRVPPARAATVVSDAPLAPWVDRVAAGLVAGVLAMVVLRRRRRRVTVSDPPTPPAAAAGDEVGAERDDQLVGVGA